MQTQTKPTLLIEADMRRTSLGPQPGPAKDQKGLSDLIAGATSIEQCMIRQEKSGLDSIPVGSRPPNPLELQMSDRFTELLGDLQGHYKMLVIVRPPLQLVIDVLVTGRNITGLVYEVKSGEKPVPIIRNGLRRVMTAVIPIIGGLLNHLNYKPAEKY